MMLSQSAFEISGRPVTHCTGCCSAEKPWRDALLLHRKRSGCQNITLAITPADGIPCHEIMPGCPTACGCVLDTFFCLGGFGSYRRLWPYNAVHFSEVH